MDWNYSLLWIVGIACVSALIRFSKAGRLVRGWIFKYIFILVVVAAVWLIRPDWAGFVGALLFVVLTLIPAILMRNVLRLAMNEKFHSAATMARVASWLHPFDGLQLTAQTYDAWDYAERGDLDTAARILEPLQAVPSHVGRLASLNLFRVRRQWRELVQWVEANRADPFFSRSPVFLPLYLRGLGEIGHVGALLITMEQFRPKLAAPIYITARSNAQLMAFTFSGRPDEVARLFQGPLRSMSEVRRQYWIGRAELAAGHIDAGRNRLNALLPSAGAARRAEIERLMNEPPPPVILSETARQILDGLALDHVHERRYSGRRQPGWRPWCTYGLVFANCAMFVGELVMGGSTDIGALYRLGAFSPLFVSQGQYWRLLTACFLHFGTAHLAMNMLALFVLGPFVESILGSIQFLLLYFLTGIGAFAVVLALAMLRAPGPEIIVGASGAIMGIIGATAAILVRGWAFEGARIAATRLRSIGFIVLIQVIFDLMTPEVSQSAHIAGLVAGFVLCSILPHRRPNSPGLKIAPLPAGQS
jgi:rhomboid protease GluP